MIFLEGPDDREALAYAIRMADQPEVKVTVVRIRDLILESIESNQEVDDVNKQLDTNMLQKFEAVVKAAGNKRHCLKDKFVQDSVEMINVVRSMERYSYDLILVGRRHSSESRLLEPVLNDWSEYPELGFIGDVLASADTNCGVSLLVVQQDNLFECHNNANSSSPGSHVMNNARNVCVDIPRDHDHDVLISNTVQPPADSQETNRKWI